MWRPLAAAPPGEPCYLAASTVHRWLDRAGVAAQASVPGQLQDLAQSAELGTDGLWARLRGGATRVVLLLLADSVTGLLWLPVVAEQKMRPHRGNASLNGGPSGRPGLAAPARRDE